MKKLLTILGMWFLSLCPIFAQNSPLSFHAGAGLGMINSVKGNSLQVGVNYRIARWVSLEGTLTHSDGYDGFRNKGFYYMNTTPNDYMKLWHQSIFSAGLNVYFTPFKRESKHLLNIGGGLGFSRQIDTSIIFYKSAGDDYWSLFNITNNGFAPCISADYTYFVGKNLGVGLKVYGVYFDDAAESLLFTLRYRLP